MGTTEHDDAAFADLCEYVEDELDFVTSYYNDSYLERRFSARLRRTEATNYREYRDLLERDPGEPEALLDSLSINVTSFFRNPDMWETFRSVLRELSAEKNRLRLWSAPCSDGREPYSMAMVALDDDEVDADRVSITGTDISEDALAAARRGVYETTETTDIAEELAPLTDYTQFVEQDGSEFAVRDRVKDMVSFERHDLIREEPPGQFELVMCRNLLIYIAPEYKEPILETLDASLTDGYLVIGKTETLPAAYKQRYEPVEKAVRVHRKL